MTDDHIADNLNPHYPGLDYAMHQWQAMIDAALGEDQA